MNTMHGTRILIALIIVASLVSAGMAFFTLYVARDYLVFANVSCDPTQHSCFVGDGENTPRYYEEVTRRANTIPACNGWFDQCQELNCADGDSSCTVQYCEQGGEDACYGPIAPN